MKKQLVSYIPISAIAIATLLLILKASHTKRFPKIELHKDDYTIRLEQNDSLYYLETQSAGTRSTLHFLHKEKFTDLYNQVNQIDSSDATQKLIEFASSHSLDHSELPPDGFELTLTKKDKEKQQTYSFTWNKSGGLISDGSLTLPVDCDRVAFIWNQLNNSSLKFLGNNIYWPYNCDSPPHSSWWAFRLRAGRKVFINCRFDPDSSDGYIKNRNHPLFDDLWQFFVNIFNESKIIATIPPDIELSYGDIEIGPFISLFRDQNLIYIKTISIPFDKSFIPPNGTSYTIAFLTPEQLSMFWLLIEKLPLDYLKNPPADAFKLFTDNHNNQWSSFFYYKVNGKKIVNWQQQDKIPGPTLQNSIGNLSYSFNSVQNSSFSVMPKKTVHLTLEKEESPGSVQRISAEIYPDGEKIVLSNGNDSSILDRTGTKRLWYRFNYLRLFSNHEGPIPFSNNTGTQEPVYRLLCSSGNHMLINETFQRSVNTEFITNASLSDSNYRDLVATINDNYFNTCFDPLWNALSKRIIPPVFTTNPDNVIYRHDEWTLEKNDSTIKISKIRTPSQCTLPGKKRRKIISKEICSSMLSKAQFMEFWDALVKIDWLVYEDILPEEEIPAPKDLSVYNPLFLQINGDKIINIPLEGGLRGAINNPLAELDAILEKYCK